MKKIEAIVRPTKIEDVKNALCEIGIAGMTVTNVVGLGRAKGYKEMYRGAEYDVEFLSKLKIEIVLDDELVDECVKIIMESGRTGEIGDGKIFVSTLDHVYRIRTSEEDECAL